MILTPLATLCNRRYVGKSSVEYGCHVSRQYRWELSDVENGQKNDFVIDGTQTESIKYIEIAVTLVLVAVAATGAQKGTQGVEVLGPI